MATSGAQVDGIDYSVTGLPYFGPLGGRPDVLLGVGYSGNGVAPTYLGAQMLAGRVLDRDLGFSHPLLGRPPQGALPPEPFRYGGGLLVRRAIAAKETREDVERRVPRVIRAVAKLDPTSFIDTGEPSKRS